MLIRDFQDNIEGLLRELSFQHPVYYAVEAHVEANSPMTATKYLLVVTAHVITEELLYKAEAVVGYTDELTENKTQAIKDINKSADEIVWGLSIKVPTVIWKRGILRPVGKATVKKV